VRVLVTSTAGSGHVHPLVPVATALRAAGHKVRWAVAEPARAGLERLGIGTVAAGMSVPERLRAFGERFGVATAALDPGSRRAIAFSGHFGHLCAPRMLTDLRPVLDEWQPDLLVHETAELAGPALAEAAGIPHAVVAFSGRVPPEALAAAAEVVAPLWAGLGVAVPADLGLYRHAYFHPFPPSMGQRPAAATVRDLRPGGEDGADGGPPAWVRALGEDRPLVYVTFGTEMGPLAPWPTLLPALGLLGGVDVVVTVGGALDPVGLGVVPPRIRVERYVPQSWLLPRCSLVVSHAGAGTLLAAAAHGVPQLLLPIGADQFENAAAYLGTGAGGWGLGLDAEGLADAMRRLLDGGGHREAAARVAGELAAMPGPGEAVEVLEGLAR
jgi:UDP:flavonoid glycosyltransferase YjiC (YdhE family)